MSIETTKAYAEGFISGWNKCRDILCKKYNLNEDEIIAWEKSDESQVAILGDREQ